MTDDDLDDAQPPVTDLAGMDEDDFLTFLTAAIETALEEASGPRPTIRTYEQARVLTYNVGLIVKIGLSEFQLTVVQSK